MLDPQARQLLDLIASLNLPPARVLGVTQTRQNYRERRNTTQPERLEMAQVTDHHLAIDGRSMLIRDYRPRSLAVRQALSDESSAVPGLVYLHGGGWTIGDVDTHDTLCRALADAAQCAVFSVDYRLGPEHRFPAAVLDADHAFQWLIGEAGRLGVDPARIAVGGDSAGGNLATVVSILARDRGGPMPRFQLLINPATDQRAGADSHRRKGDGYLLTSDMMQWFRGQYHADESEYLDWRASPLLTPDLGGLPPALMIVAEYDPLVDEGRAYTARLNEAGVNTRVVSFDGQIHGFITMERVVDAASDAIAVCASGLRTAFLTA